MNKKGVEFSFTWIFVLLVGASILFLAIFAATKILKTGDIEYQTEVAAQLGALLSPLETNLESGKYYSLKMPGETKIFNDCTEQGSFGKQEISVSVKSGLVKDSNRGVPYSFYNKYVFSDSAVEGKELNIFVKPFAFPYKVGDLIFIYNKKYCFVNPPSDIEDEILAFGLKDINISESKSQCPASSVKVCFQGEGCDVSVQIEGDKQGRVIKGNKNVAYYDSLMYGAILSDYELYQCQLTRLRKRASQLALLYSAKTGLISEGCGSGLAGELGTFSQRLNNNEIKIIELVFDAENLGEKNERLICPIF